MNILFFQYGDYGESYRRFGAGEPETYRDQKQSVDFVAALRSAHDVTVMAICARTHDERLAGNLRSIGIPQATASSPAALAPLLTGLAPDLIVCRTPNLHLLRWARRHHVPTLPIFADLFTAPGPLQLLKSLVLRRTLGAGVFPCVANHSLNASLSVARVLHYPEARIIPWDWSRLAVAGTPKTAPADPARLTAFFAGLLTAPKGVGDCLEAVALLRDRGLHLQFDFAGPGDSAPWLARAAELGIAGQISFPGRLSHDEVRERMRAADIVVVPSRHDYAEGLPNTIYEALASRSALLVSDHPAFAGRLRPGEDCLEFRAADPGSLADRIADLAHTPGLYARLSQNAAAAHDALYVGTEWTQLVATFLADPRNRTGWVASQSLKRLREGGFLPDQRLKQTAGASPS